MPSRRFLLGLYLLFFGGVVLGWFPLFGMETFGNEGDPMDIAWHLALPVASLALQQVAGWSRYVRASMLEVLHQDYVRTAHAKGLPARRVTFKHALRNAIIPVITLVGLTIPTLLGGAAITEAIFSWPASEDGVQVSPPRLPGLLWLREIGGVVSCSAPAGRSLYAVAIRPQRRGSRQTMTSSRYAPATMTGISPRSD